MDTFFEQIVAKKKGAPEWLIIIGTILAGLLVLGFVFLFANSFLVIALVGVGYGAWWLITTQNVEYEYCVTNGDIDIDKITALSASVWCRCPAARSNLCCPTMPLHRWVSTSAP